MLMVEFSYTNFFSKGNKRVLSRHVRISNYTHNFNEVDEVSSIMHFYFVSEHYISLHRVEMRLHRDALTTKKFFFFSISYENLKYKIITKYFVIKKFRPNQKNHKMFLNLKLEFHSWHHISFSEIHTLCVIILYMLKHFVYKVEYSPKTI